MKLAAGTRLAEFIDHTLLSPQSTEQDIERLCAEAVEHRVWAVCVNPIFVPLARRLLTQTPVKLCSVVSFPLGATPVGVKVLEAKEATRAGADEIDIVPHIGAFKSGDFEYVEHEIQQVISGAKTNNPAVIVKIILECGLLSDEEKMLGCKTAMRAGADFVKTSTGFGPHGATIDDVKLLRETVGPDFGVKAAGGIRSLEDAMAMIDAGANRIGTSSTVRILRES